MEYSVAETGQNDESEFEIIFSRMASSSGTQFEPTSSFVNKSSQTNSSEQLIE